MINQKLTPSMMWFTKKTIIEDHGDIPVSQVYCWVHTKDAKIILVSKNGKKWQFPGGHPNGKESLVETCVREVEEEAGVDISDKSDNIRMFGYYLLREWNENKTALEDKLQTRFYVAIDQNSIDMSLKPNEKKYEVESEKINFVKAVSLDEACKIIPWLGSTKEIGVFKKLIK